MAIPNADSASRGRALVRPFHDGHRCCASKREGMYLRVQTSRLPPRKSPRSLLDS